MRAGPFGQLALDARGAGEAAFLAPALAAWTKPGQPRPARCRVVDVVAVKAEPCFQPQRIAGAKADRLDLGFGQQSASATARAALP